MPRVPRRRGSRAGSLLLCASLLTTGIPNVRADGDLYAGFVDPPDSARPYAWWHWIGGDVDPEQAALDLQWLSDIGIGGVQLFDVSLGKPRDDRLRYGSRAWQMAVRASASEARSLGLEFAVTTSPGWSASGGPWVDAADAMHKLVWSTTRVTGGRQLSMTLPRPPATTGPYQDIPSTALGEHDTGQSHYRDLAVVAVPAGPAKPQFSISTSRDSGEAGLLQDGRFWPATDIVRDSSGGAWIQYTSVQPVTIRALTVGQPGRRGFGSPQAPAVRLEVSDDGVLFRQVVELPATGSLVRSASFAPATGHIFRVVLEPSGEPGFMDTLHYAPGVIPLGVPGEPSAYPVSEIELHADSRVHAVEEKSGFAPAADYYAIRTPEVLQARFGIDDVLIPDGPIADDGRLEWTAPPGEWDVIRFGCSLTGATNGPAVPEATGLEVDKLANGKVEKYLDTYLARFRDDGALFDGIGALLSDSIEAGSQNCTDSLLAEFRNFAGYDATPWLAAVTGRLIGNPGATDRFLWDFRALIAKLLERNYYSVIARKTEQLGLVYYAEALEDHRPQLGNDLDMRMHADVPMSAFWHFPAAEAPKATYAMDVEGAASVASLYGKPIIAAEALTTFGHPWAVGPRELKLVADRAFVHGANRLVMHSSVHQPTGRNFTPGRSMMPLLGHYLNRNVTWSGMADAWMLYLARTQYLLQQGQRVTRFAYFIGEEAPVTGLFGDRPPAGLPRGFAYDFVSAAGLDELSVEGGKLRSRAGAEYEFIFLGGSSRYLTGTTLARIRELAAQGAAIAGEKPVASPSLVDEEGEFANLVDEIWAFGNVIDAETPTVAVEHFKLEATWIFATRDGRRAGEIRVLPRRTDRESLFFVVNTGADTVTGRFALRDVDRGLRPEIWRAVSGSRESVAGLHRDRGTIEFDLELRPHEAVFVVLASDEQPPGTTDHEPDLVLPFAGSWRVSFDPRFGIVPAFETATLESFDQHPDERVRHYSGIATYSNKFALDPEVLAGANSILFRVSSVGDIARVFVNDRQAGALWTLPYAIDIGPLLRTGWNEIRVEVANVWANRLIGLARENQDRAGFPTGIYSADAPLRQAGLIGPAVLEIR